MSFLAYDEMEHKFIHSYVRAKRKLIKMHWLQRYFIGISRFASLGLTYLKLITILMIFKYQS